MMVPGLEPVGGQNPPDSRGREVRHDPLCNEFTCQCGAIPL
jgi:hypothetical protein